jgi:hypothetical protein
MDLTRIVPQKLSDFAFLVVAPVLLTVLLPLRVPARRAMAFAAVGAVFVATDLSPAASDAVVALAARAGLRWRLWPDVTDLLALLVQPLAWWIAKQRPGRLLYPVHRILKPVGVALGALACLATSDVGTNTHYPFFVNQTGGPRVVELTWLLRKVDCKSDLASVAATLSLNDLDDSHQVTLASSQVAALDLPPASDDGMAGVCRNSTSKERGGSTSCTAVVVSVPGGPAALVSASRHWEISNSETPPLACSPTPATTSPCAPVMAAGQDAGTDALTLVETGGQLRFEAGSKLQMVPLNWADVAARASATPGCKDRLLQLQAIVSLAKSCTADSDCQVLNASIAVPSKGICNVYVNRSLSFGTVLKLREAWKEQCAIDDRFSCSIYGPVQPAACHSGQCGELCPDRVLHGCPQSCTAAGILVGAGCGDFAGIACLAPDGRYCTCADRTSTLTCRPQSEVLPDCPIACVVDRPISSIDANGYRGDAAAYDDATVDQGQGIDGESHDLDTGVVEVEP